MLYLATDFFFSFHIKLIMSPFVGILNMNFDHFAQRLTDISLYSHGIVVVVLLFFCFWKMALLSLGGALRSPVTVCNNSYWFSCYCFVISQYKHITRESIEFNEKETKKNKKESKRNKPKKRAIFFITYKLIENKKIPIRAKQWIVGKIDVASLYFCCRLKTICFTSASFFRWYLGLHFGRFILTTIYVQRKNLIVFRALCTLKDSDQ